MRNDDLNDSKWREDALAYFRKIPMQYVSNASFETFYSNGYTQAKRSSQVEVAELQTQNAEMRLDRFLYFQLQEKYDELGKAHVERMNQIYELKAQNEELRNLVTTAITIVEEQSSIITHDEFYIQSELVNEWLKAAKQGKE